MAIWPAIVPRQHSHKGVTILCPSVEDLLNLGTKAHKEDVEEVGKSGSLASMSCTTMRVTLTPSMSQGNCMCHWTLDKLLPSLLRRKYQKYKKLKRTYASVAADGATLCSARIGPQKDKKNLREICEYLSKNRIDRTQFWRRVGGVLVCNMEALEQRMEGEAGQRSQKGSVIGYCSCGAVYPPRVKRGGDRDARRIKQRANRGRSRDNRTISCALARALNPLQGGSTPRNTEMPSKL